MEGNNNSSEYGKGKIRTQSPHIGDTMSMSTLKHLHNNTIGTDGLSTLWLYLGWPLMWVCLLGVNARVIVLNPLNHFDIEYEMAAMAPDDHGFG